MRRSLGIAFLCLVACSSKGNDTPPSTEDAGDQDPLAPLGPGPSPTAVNLAPSCGATGDAKLGFVRKTDAWELDDAHLGVRGNHIQAIDLDHDGYPDLLIESGGSARSDPSLEGPKQLVRVLMNRPKDGGGRHFVDETVPSNYGAARSDVKVPAGTLLRASQLAVAADVDNDGDIDVFSGTYVDPSKPENDTGDRNDIVLNDGTGKFALAPKSDLQTVTGSLLPPTSSASFVDADRDGIVDLWIGFWYQVYGSTQYGVQARLLKGNGDGTFKDVTVGSGLETITTGYDLGKNHRPAYGVTTCDLDDDGAPELLVSAYGRQWNLLYQNLGGLKFADVGRPSGYGGDQNVDYSDNEFYKCYCATSMTCTPSSAPRLDCSNPSGWSWSSSDTKPWRNNGNTFTTACADLNGDGKLDLYSAEIAHWHIGQSSDKSELLVNDGPVEGAPIHFNRPGRVPTGLDWKHDGVDWNEGGIMVAAADLDLDGMLDIVVGASDYPGNFSMVYRQKSPGVFEEVGEAIGLHHECTNGLAIADFDRDGDLDVVVGSSTARDCAKTWSKGNEVHFYENTTNDGAAKHGFLQVAFEGKGKGGANRSGIGARVRVLREDGTVQMQELGGGYGHFGQQHDTSLTFGLGTSCAPKAIEVRWPNGELTKARYTGIGGGRRVLIKETGEVTEVPK